MARLVARLAVLPALQWRACVPAAVNLAGPGPEPLCAFLGRLARCLRLPPTVVVPANAAGKASAAGPAYFPSVTRGCIDTRLAESLPGALWTPTAWDAALATTARFYVNVRSRWRADEGSGGAAADIISACVHTHRRCWARPRPPWTPCGRC